MTPVYPSSVDVGALSSFVMDETCPSKPWGDNTDADEEEDLSPELLLYTNIKQVTMVMMTMMMPPTPWHWRDTGKT